MTSDFRGLPKCISAKYEILAPSILQGSSPKGNRGAHCYPTTGAPHRACSQAMHHLVEIIIRNYLGEITEVRYQEVLLRSSLYTWNCAYLDEIIYSNFSFLELFVMRVELSCMHVIEVFNPVRSDTRIMHVSWLV